MRWSLTVVVALGIIGLPPLGWSQQPKQSKHSAAIDPATIAALEKMGAFLRTQQAIGIRVDTETDEVLESGQKIQLSGTTMLSARRPDRLRAEVISDRKHRQFFYDGSTSNAGAPGTNLATWARRSATVVNAP